MDIEIHTEGTSICVVDKDIEYSISLLEPHDVEYGSNIIFVPFVNNLIKTRSDYHVAISDNRDEIKKYINILSDIFNNLPNLVLCQLPIYPIFGSSGNSSYLCHDDNSVVFETSDLSDEGYLMHLYFNESVNCIDFYVGKDPEPHDGYNIYSIKDKIAVTNEPFDAELFASAIRSYVSEHLIGLFNLFRVSNIKSAKK